MVGPSCLPIEVLGHSTISWNPDPSAEGPAGPSRHRSMVSVVKQVVAALVAGALVLGGTSAAMAVPEPEVTSAADASKAGPRVKVSNVRLMGAKKINVVRKVWTAIDVRVTNTGGSTLTRPIVLTGSGRGMAARRVARSYPLDPGESIQMKMRIRLNGARKRAPFRIKATTGGVSTTTAVRVTKVKPPKKPRPGRYVSPNGKVRFTVTKKGRIAKFRGTQQLQCGYWPQFTYQTQRHSFPLTNIPRSGRIDRSVNAKNQHYYELRMFIRGNRAIKGYFWVNGGYCTGAMRFRANRKG